VAAPPFLSGAGAARGGQNSRKARRRSPDYPRQQIYYFWGRGTIATSGHFGVEEAKPGASFWDELLPGLLPSGSRQEINPQDGAGFFQVGKALPPVRDEIWVGGCHAGGKKKGALRADLFSFPRP
jgi:hypothetical protein